MVDKSRNLEQVAHEPEAVHFGLFYMYTIYLMDTSSTKKSTSIEEATNNARWLVFVIEFAGSAIAYMILKATLGLAAAELFMLVAFALALCASTGSASALVKENLKRSRLKSALSQEGEEEKEDGKEEKDNAGEDV